MAKSKSKSSRKKDKPHDAVFKTFFGDVGIVRNYLAHYTGPEVYRHIDLAALRKCDTAFVGGRFGLSFSDVVYETRLNTGAPVRLLFLFEHKSYQPEHPVQLQLLDYMLQLWEDDLRNSRPLSFIIPAVVYHGEKGWTQDSFFDYFSGMPEHWRAFLPDFRYWLTDLSAVSVEDIHAKIESEYLRNLFLALKLSRNAELARKNWKKIFTFGGVLENEVRAQMFFQTLTLYIYIVSGMSQGEIKTLSTQLSEAENSWVDAIPEIFGEKWKQAGLRKGRRQGFKKGIEKGREEGLSEGLEKGIEKGREEAFEEIVKKIMLKFPQWSDAEVAAFLDAEEGDVKQLRRILEESII